MPRKELFIKINTRTIAESQSLVTTKCYLKTQTMTYQKVKFNP